MQEQDLLTQEQIKEIIKLYLIEHLKLDLKVDQGYNATDPKFINIVVKIGEAVITSVTEQI